MNRDDRLGLPFREYLRNGAIPPLCANLGQRDRHRRYHADPHPIMGFAVFLFVEQPGLVAIGRSISVSRVPLCSSLAGAETARPYTGRRSAGLRRNHCERPGIRRFPFASNPLEVGTRPRLLHLDLLGRLQSGGPFS